jgi:hypothetical protein
MINSNQTYIYGDIYMEIVESRQSELGDETYTFVVNALSEQVQVRLIGYQLKNKNTVLKKWAHIGNNGTFIKRDSIVIPESVVESAFQKVTSTISIA